MTENIDKDYVCGDFGEVTEWLQIKVTVKTERLDELVALMSVIESNLLIDDLSDIDLKTCYGDLIDEKILNADKSHASVSYFVPKDANIADDMAFLRDRLASGGFTDANIEVIGLCEEDWANSWKEFYKPFKIGRIVIVPAWEKYEAGEGELIVRMDPGMAFGTGSHETTRLVIKLLEKYVRRGMRVADVGCGSGILSIAAMLLGAESAVMVDIFKNAADTAAENMEKNGFSSDKFKSFCGNIIDDELLRNEKTIPVYDEKIGFFKVVLVGIFNNNNYNLNVLADELRIRYAWIVHQLLEEIKKYEKVIN